jgi:hypothetical protein
LSAAALYNLVAASLLVGACVSMFPIPSRQPAGVVAAIVSLFTLAPAVAGLVGPPSVTLTQVALLQLCGQKDLIARETAAAALLVMVAAIFYPLSLGFGPFDPFDIGYRPKLLLVAMIPIGIALIVHRKHVLLLIGAVDLLAYALGLFENLWSAFFDPLLVLLCCASLAKTAARHFLQRYSVSTPCKPNANQPGSEYPHS